MPLVCRQFKRGGLLVGLLVFLGLCFLFNYGPAKADKKSGSTCLYNNECAERYGSTGVCIKGVCYTSSPWTGSDGDCGDYCVAVNRPLGCVSGKCSTKMYLHTSKIVSGVAGGGVCQCGQQDIIGDVCKPGTICQNGSLLNGPTNYTINLAHSAKCVPAPADCLGTTIKDDGTGCTTTDGGMAKECITFCNKYNGNDGTSCQAQGYYSADSHYGDTDQKHNWFSHMTATCSTFLHQNVPYCTSAKQGGGARICLCSYWDVTQCAGGCVTINGTAAQCSDGSHTRDCSADTDCATPKAQCADQSTAYPTDNKQAVARPTGYNTYVSTCNNCQCQTKAVYNPCSDTTHNPNDTLVCESDAEAHDDGSLPAGSKTELGLGCYTHCVPLDGGWTNGNDTWVVSSTAAVGDCNPEPNLFGQKCTQRYDTVKVQTCTNPKPNKCGQYCDPPQPTKTVATYQNCTLPQGKWQVQSVKTYTALTSCSVHVPCMLDDRTTTIYQCNKQCGATDCGPCPDNSTCMGRQKDGNCLDRCVKVEITSTKPCSDQTVKCSPAVLPAHAAWWGDTGFTLKCTVVIKADGAKAVEWKTNYNPTAYTDEQTTDPCRWRCKYHYKSVNHGYSGPNTPNNITCEPETKTLPCPGVGDCAGYGPAGSAKAVYYTQTWDDSSDPAGWNPSTPPTPVYAGKATAKDQCVYDCVANAHPVNNGCQGDQRSQACGQVEILATIGNNNGEKQYKAVTPTTYTQAYDCLGSQWTPKIDMTCAANSAADTCTYACDDCNGYIPASKSGCACAVKTCAVGGCYLPFNTPGIIEVGAKTYPRVLDKQPGVACYACDPLALQDVDVYIGTQTNVNHCYYDCDKANGYDWDGAKCAKKVVDCLPRRTGKNFPPNMVPNTEEQVWQKFIGGVWLPDNNYIHREPPQASMNQCFLRCADDTADCHYIFAGRDEADIAAGCVCQPLPHTCDDNNPYHFYQNNKGDCKYTFGPDTYFNYPQKYAPTNWTHYGIDNTDAPIKDACLWHCAAHTTRSGNRCDAEVNTADCLGQAILQKPDDRGVVKYKANGPLDYLQTWDCTLGDWDKKDWQMVYGTKPAACHYICNQCGGYIEDNPNQAPYCKLRPCDQGTCRLPQPENNDTAKLVQPKYLRELKPDPADANHCYACAPAALQDDAVHDGETNKTNVSGCQFVCREDKGYYWSKKDQKCEPLQPCTDSPDNTCRAYIFGNGTYKPDYTPTQWTHGTPPLGDCYYDCASGFAYNPGKKICEKTQPFVCDNSLKPEHAHWNLISGWTQYWSCRFPPIYWRPAEDNHPIETTIKNTVADCDPANGKTNCHCYFACDQYYRWDGSACVPDDTLPDCTWQPVGKIGLSASTADYESLAFDPVYDTPYLAYRDGHYAGGQATVMFFDGQAWFAYGKPGFSGGYAKFLSMAMRPGESGRPFVAFAGYEYSTKELTVMDYEQRNWNYYHYYGDGLSAGRVDDTSLAFNADNQPCVAYEDYKQNNQVAVTCYNAANDAWEQLGNTFPAAGTADYTSLAFDKQGVPYVAFHDKTNGDRLTVMYYDAQAQKWLAKGPAGFVGAFASDKHGWRILAFSNKNEPYVVYIDDNGRASVQKWNKTAWAPVGALGFSGDEVDYVSLAFNPVNNLPYVAFARDPNGQDPRASVMAFNNKGKWVPVGAKNVSLAGARYESLAFSSLGQPYLAYADDSNLGRSGATVMTCTSTVLGVKINKGK